MKTKQFITIVMASLLILIGQVLYGQDHSKYSCQVGEIAFGGYDLVSYFQGGPVLGKKVFTTEYDGITLQFATAQNLKAFVANPERYMPAYGGWCATAAAHNTFVVPNYDMYKIQDDKLLFFEVRGFFNGLSQWEKDPQKHEILADKTYRDKLTQIAAR